MRAAAHSQMGRDDEARAAAAELLELEPDFATHGRRLVGRYVKVDGLTDRIIEGLRKAGLVDIERIELCPDSHTKILVDEDHPDPSLGV